VLEARQSNRQWCHRRRAVSRCGTSPESTIVAPSGHDRPGDDEHRMLSTNPPVHVGPFDRRDSACPPPRGHTIAQFDTYWHPSPGLRDSPRSLAGTARACSRTHLVSTDFGDTSPECLSAGFPARALTLVEPQGE
jgi:hypothetical protein